MIDLYDFRELRIRRKQAHAAAKVVSRIPRTPVTDRLRSVARNEARAANLIHAFATRRPLTRIETVPVKTKLTKSNDYSYPKGDYNIRVARILEKYTDAPWRDIVDWIHG